MTDSTHPRSRGVNDPGAPERTTPDPESGGVVEVDAAVFAQLRAEVADLRLQLGEEVRTRRVVVVDEAGAPRIRLTASAGGDSQVALLDGDGFERVWITGNPDIGTMSVAARSRGGDPTQVDVFALDRDEDDGAYVGLELIDRGTSVAGFALYEGRQPRPWTAPR
jgi:hypothetical protein